MRLLLLLLQIQLRWRLLAVMVIFISTLPQVNGDDVDLWQYCENGTMVTSGRINYFVFNNTRHRFPDRYTHLAYGFYFRRNPPPLEGIAFGDTAVGEPIQSLWKPNEDNEYVKSMRSSMSVASHLILENHKILYGGINAAILYLPPYLSEQYGCGGSWLLKIALPSSVNRFLVIDSADANTTALSVNFHNSIKWLQNASDYQRWISAEPGVPFIDLVSADPRLLLMNDGRVFTTYAAGYRAEPNLRPLYTQLFVYNASIPTRHRIAYYDLIEINFHVTGQPELHRSDQKNWVPFEYNNKLFFIINIWPMRTIEVTFPNPQTPWIGLANYEKIWIQPTPEEQQSKMPWKYGWPHGSTQAVKLASGEWLAFFHSYKSVSKYGVVMTYFMGAFTFEVNETKAFGSDNYDDFILTAISSKPIISEKMYTGPWYYDANLWGFIDYAVFPVSIMLEGDYVFMTYALQDIHNHIAKIDLKTLLLSLTPVIS